ncbi:alpha/beta hydrolase [Streptomyces sp. MST-110588]|uniref:alpha/beta hydrolase n=1 Tax=Streptomyces sp. MST-110588 TaxID=2833628 RepID=UPI001F5DE95D|nr:alpha/beta hydrolase [Streptomyces sp. MST-110588]
MPDGSVQYPAAALSLSKTVTATADVPVPFLPRKADADANPNRAKAEDIAKRIAAALRDAVAVDERYRSVLGKLKTTRGLKVDDAVWADAGHDLKDVRKVAGGYLKESDIPKGKSPTDNKKWWESLSQERRDEYTALYPASVGALDGLPATVRDQANRVVLAESRATAQLELDNWLKLNKEPDRYRTYYSPYGRHSIDGVKVDTEEWKEWNEKKQELAGPLEGMNAIQRRLVCGSDKIGAPEAYLLGFSSEGNGRAIVANGNPDTADHTAVYVPGTGSNLAGIDGDIRRMADTWNATHEFANSQNVSTITWLGYDAPQNIVKDSPFSHYADDGAPAFNSFVDGLKAANETKSSGHLTAIGHSYGTTLIGSAARQGDLNADDVVFAGSPGVQVGSAKEMDVPQGHVWNEEADRDFVPDIGRFGHGGSQWRLGGGTFINPSDDLFGANQMSTDTTEHSNYWNEKSTSLLNQAAVVAGRYDKVERDE